MSLTIEELKQLRQLFFLQYDDLISGGLLDSRIKDLEHYDQKYNFEVIADIKQYLSDIRDIDNHISTILSKTTREPHRVDVYEEVEVDYGNWTDNDLLINLNQRRGLLVGYLSDNLRIKSNLNSGRKLLS